MSWQRDIFQMKEQDKISEELSKVKQTHIELERREGEHSETFNKELL